MVTLFGEAEVVGAYQREPKTIAVDSPIHRQPAGEGKVCGACKRFLPFEEFSWNSGPKNCGRKYRCSKCRECAKARAREWYHNPHKKRKRRNTQMRCMYEGFTLAEYEAMWDAQGGRCASCGVHESDLPLDKRTNKPRQLDIDHDHATGAVRALLCPRCNMGLGCFGDDIQKLQAAISYLQKHIVRHEG